MALPKAAKKQLEAAEQLHAEAYPEGVEPEAPELKEVTSEPEAQAEAPSVEAEAPESPVSEVPAAESGDKENDPAHWKHKYDVLRGKYDAEVPRLQQSNSALQGRVGEMEAQMLQLSQQMATPQTPVEPGTHLSQDEIEDYGSDMIDVVKRAAREEFEPMVSGLQQENQNLRSLLGGMQQQSALSARDEMLSTLDGELSNWRTLNQADDFLGWLENVDPYSGHKKLDLLRQAFENNNTSRVLAFFKGFLNENATYAASTPTPDAAPQIGLDTLVAPGRATEGGEARAQEGNATGRMWSQSDISTFYRDVQRGVYRNDPDERARLENDIFLAQEQGRISP